MKLTAHDVCTATGGVLVAGHRDAILTSVSIDSRTATRGALFVPLLGERADGHAYLAAAVKQGAAGFFFASHLNSSLPDGAVAIAVADPLTALQDLASWYRRRLNARVVGIAGSNGKTTTKELMAQVCAAQRRALGTPGNLNNHIGLPLALLRAEENVELLVLELGTSGAGELTTLCHIAQPHIGVITSIAEEHTETLKDLAGVIAAETEIIAALPADGVAIVNGDHDELLATVRQQARCRIVTFGERMNNDFRINEVVVSRQGTRFSVTTPTGVRTLQLQLLGSHFALAATASLAVTVECGLDLDVACSTLQTAHGAARRMAVVEVPARQLTILDDCYNANPTSMLNALQTAKQVRRDGERLVLVLGDMLELGSLSQTRHREIGQAVASLHPRPDLVVAVGSDAREMGHEIEEAGIPVHVFAAAHEASVFVRDSVQGFGGPQLVLIKGSRGIHLEEVTRQLTE